MKKIIFLGLLMSLFGCSKSTDKEVTSFQGFDWGEDSQTILERLGEPYEVSADGLTFKYNDEQIRVQFNGNKVLRTEFVFEPSESVSTATQLKSIASDKWDCSELQCSLVQGDYWFEDTEEEAALELLKALDRTYYKSNDSRDRFMEISRSWVAANRAFIRLRWTTGGTYEEKYLTLRLGYVSPQKVAEMVGEPYDELEL